MRHTQNFDSIAALLLDDYVRVLLNNRLSGARLAPWPPFLGKMREGIGGAMLCTACATRDAKAGLSWVSR